MSAEWRLQHSATTSSSSPFAALHRAFVQDLPCDELFAKVHTSQQLCDVLQETSLCVSRISSLQSELAALVVKHDVEVRGGRGRGRGCGRWLRHLHQLLRWGPG